MIEEKQKSRVCDLFIGGFVVLVIGGICYMAYSPSDSSSSYSAPSYSAPPQQVIEVRTRRPALERFLDENHDRDMIQEQQDAEESARKREKMWSDWEKRYGQRR